ncbi:MAG: biotin transporter BioY, partial [Clostridia bacterium]|nr:biotin transporter BioY [Clostridia bacterium]
MSSAKRRLGIRDMTYIALFTAVTAVCSWIAIPLTIPITLQTFAIFVTAGFLGLKRGMLSVALYI